MAQLNEIVGKENLQQIVDLDAKINKATDSFVKQIQVVKELNSILTSNSVTWKEVKAVQEQTIASTNKLGASEKELEKISKEQAAAIAALDKQRQAAYAQMAKNEAKEKDLAAAISMQVKSIKDAELQNKALMEAKKKLNLTTDEGRKKNDQYNQSINKNTEFIRKNSDAATKQRMNIGNYGSALKDAGSKLLSFAGGLGIGITMMSAFKDILFSTRESANAIKDTIAGTKEAFSFLARSIATVDFTNLIQGFRDAFREGERYSQTLRDIAAQQRALGITKADIEGQILDQKIKARQALRMKDVASAEAAVNEIIRLETLKMTETKTVTTADLQNALDHNRAITKLNDEEIIGIVENQAKYKEAISAGADLQLRLNSLITTTTLVTGGVIRNYGDYNKALKNLTPEQQNQLKLYEGANVLLGDQRDKIAQLMIADIQAVNEQKSGILSLEKLRGRLMKELQAEAGLEENAANQKGKNLNEEAKLEGDLLNTKKDIANFDEEQAKKRSEEAEKKLAYIEKQKQALYELVAAYRDEAAAEDLGGVDSAMAEITALQDFAAAAYANTTDVKLANLEKQHDDLVMMREKDLITEKEYQAAIAENEGSQRDIRLEKAQTYVNALADIGNMLLEINQMQLDNQVAQMEKSKAQELQLAGNNAEKITKINEKYAAEEKRLKIKQAKQNRTVAIFNAIIGTAGAIINGLQTQPFMPLGILMGVLAGILGAVQIGLIASQPIPQFFKGTKSAPGGVISVGEKGEEMIQTRSGRVLMASRPTLLSGMKGARIYSNKETEAILNRRNAGYDSGELRTTLERNNEKLIKTIQNKKEVYMDFGKREIRERDGGHWTSYKNRYFR